MIESYLGAAGADGGTTVTDARLLPTVVRGRPGTTASPSCATSTSRRCGEIVALLGANGAGKTTTLLCVSAINPILAGDVELFGSSIRRSPCPRSSPPRPRPRPRGPLLFFQLTVGENLRLGASAGADRRRRSSTSRRCADRRPPGRAAVRRRAADAGDRPPLATGRLLMIDEMSLGLAPIVVERLLPILRRVADDTGRRAARRAARPPRPRDRDGQLGSHGDPGRDGRAGRAAENTSRVEPPSEELEG